MSVSKTHIHRFELYVLAYINICTAVCSASRHAFMSFGSPWTWTDENLALSHARQVCLTSTPILCTIHKFWVFGNDPIEQATPGRKKDDARSTSLADVRRKHGAWLMLVEA